MVGSSKDLVKSLQLYQFPKSYSPYHTACNPPKLKAAKGGKEKSEKTLLELQPSISLIVTQYTTLNYSCAAATLENKG